MIKKIAWNTFKNTGDVNTFLEFRQIQNVEEQIQEKTQINLQNTQEQKAEENGNNKIKWDNNF